MPSTPRPTSRIDLLDYNTFRKALASMGIKENDRADRLERESGRSPTILRRRLSKNAAIEIPEWARDNATAKALAPIALLGVWHADRKADREIVEYVASRLYETVEHDVTRLLHFEDSPVWSIGGCRGVASKIDALFAVARAISQAELDRFFDAAKSVLSESDPGAELPEKNRWAAALYGKNRDHSGALREGICETLVLLSLHGNHLFQSRHGIDVENRVAGLIRGLLTPLAIEKLLSQEYSLPHYAEAAPKVFLEIIEEDLRKDGPVIFELLKPAAPGVFGGSPSRTGLLWALECLAWNPQHLARVTRILANLSRTKINDNWVNKPANSLQSIFRSWMPQTAASVEQRCKALEILAREYPDVGWDICIDQIKPGPRTGHYNYKPRWRSDATGAREGADLPTRFSILPAKRST